MAKKIITKKSEAFLKEYLNNPSPTGFESGGQKLWLDYIKPYVDTHIVDTYGTVVGIINPEAKYKVVIEAHADEISWFVHYITKDGFIYLRRNGGSDHHDNNEENEILFLKETNDHIAIWEGAKLSKEEALRI